ncbi:hypothetical protein QTO34_018149 [Cnephaeus nilssonii]|uniref:Uncharacterized protein n=1 Tax=Cnephaeus nilssonii TaxID=3371016 RepID=A0AA40HYB1_CNENI|nr:hypothetical protein QTO34_018149 [Eptesicus nilssonii]
MRQTRIRAATRLGGVSRALASPCAAAEGVLTAMLAWMGMRMTLWSEEPGEAAERGAVLNSDPPSTRITPESSEWASDGIPSTSNRESSRREAKQKTCKNSDIEK